MRRYEKDARAFLAFLTSQGMPTELTRSSASTWSTSSPTSNPGLVVAHARMPRPSHRPPWPVPIARYSKRAVGFYRDVLGLPLVDARHGGTPSRSAAGALAPPRVTPGW